MRLDADPKLVGGDLAQMLTIVTVLIEFDGEAWPESIIKFVPEISSLSNRTDPIEHVREGVILGGAG